MTEPRSQTVKASDFGSEGAGSTPAAAAKAREAVDWMRANNPAQADHIAADGVRDAVDALNKAIERAVRQGLDLEFERLTYTDIGVGSWDVFNVRIFRRTETEIT